VHQPATRACAEEGKIQRLKRPLKPRRAGPITRHGSAYRVHAFKSVKLKLVE
jgi:hypothetical protein